MRDPQVRATLLSPVNPHKLLFEATKLLDGLTFSANNKDRYLDRSLPSVFQYKVSIAVSVMVSSTESLIYVKQL